MQRAAGGIAFVAAVLAAALVSDSAHAASRGAPARRGAAELSAHDGGSADLATKCDASACDSVRPLGNFSDAGLYMYQTSKGNGDRLTQHGLNFTQDKPSHWFSISVDDSVTYQTMVGFGGAFTDASAINFHNMSKGVQEQLLKQYFGAGGIGYSLGRVPIANTDFSLSLSTYDDVAGDLSLSHFSIQQDRALRLPLIKQALDLTELSLFASPWSAPGWMKDNGNVTNGQLNGEAGDETHKAWARYFSLFLDEYAKEGVDFWGVTVQNEPQAGKDGHWQAMEFTAEQERDFIKLDLGPQLNATHPHVRLIMLDDQRTFLPSWTKTVLGDPDAAKFVAGIGVHWYAEVEDAIPDFSLLSAAHDKHPDKFILATEACEGYLPWSKGPRLGDWKRGETIAHDVMGDVNHWAVGWCDWNLFLDLQGGPTWAQNFVDAPILLDTRNATVFYKNPMFYYLGHFSAFVPPKSVRVGVDSKGPLGLAALEATAFRVPEGLLVLVVLNRDALSGRSFWIKHPSLGYVDAHIPASSIQTYVMPSE